MSAVATQAPRIDHIEARITGPTFSTFAIMSDGTEHPDEIRGARIVGAFTVGNRRTHWLLRDGSRWIVAFTRSGRAGAFVTCASDLTPGFIMRAAAHGAAIVWGSS